MVLLMYLYTAAVLVVLVALACSVVEPVAKAAPKLFQESSETVDPAISCQFRNTCIKEHNV
jgi:hypothetical protein